MGIFQVLSMIGGLSLFLYGMDSMGAGLAKMAGGKLERILERLTAKKIFAVLLGLGVTAVIQSSSATTVMVVGFVNSGVMKLSQAVGIIMGANVGTTITSWILSLTGIEGDALWIQLLKPSSFTPVLAAIGIILIMSSKGESRKKDVGGILIGFAVLMFGMETMADSVAGLANNPSFTGLMLRFRNPILGMIVGTVLTAVIQSSSASVGILQALCATGAVHYSVALPIIMGQNIGTCVTSLLSSVGASKNAKRAAMVHVYFNTLGTILFMGVFYTLNIFLDFTFLEHSANAFGIAIIHSLFNITATIFFYPFSKVLVRLAELTVPEEKYAALEPGEPSMAAIDDRFLTRPAFAMEVCRKKAREMANVTRRAIDYSLDNLLDYSEEKAAEVARLEALADDYEDSLGTYLVKLSGQDLSVRDSQSMSVVLHSLSDFERISDHAMGITKAAEELHQKKLEFSAQTKAELETLCRAVRDICNLTVDSFCNGDEQMAVHVEPLEQVVDTLSKKVKENHIKRLQNGNCTIELGFILEDILVWLERVSDHCSNVAVEMITILDNEYTPHEYFKNFSEEEQFDFNEEYEKLIKEYPVRKKDGMIS